MAKNTYIDERNIKLNDKLGNILSNLPIYVRDFFISIESSTSFLTRVNYATDLTLFFKYIKDINVELSDLLIKEIPFSAIKKVTSSDIDYFLNYIGQYRNNGRITTNKDKAKKRKLSTLRSFFKYYYKNDMLDKDVASKVNNPTIHYKNIVRLENEEVVSLLNAIENQYYGDTHKDKYNLRLIVRDMAIVSLFLGTGIRISELVGINIHDMELENRRFIVTRKGGDRAVLYFSNEVAEAIQAYMDIRISNIKADKNENALFLSTQNKRISIKAVQNLVKKYAKASVPLKNITPHKLRSTYGTNLYKSTHDIYVVAEVLGHKDVNTTKRHYAAMSEDIKKSAAEKVLLRPSKK